MTRRSGFTLIELLVVISIIALLIGILLPSLGAARKTARAIQCSTILRQYQLASAIYSNDYDGHFAWQRLNITSTQRRWWTQNQEFKDYLNSSADVIDNSATTDSINTDLVCPDSREVEDVSSGDMYRLNWVYGYNMDGTDPNVGPYPHYRTVRIEDIVDPSDKMSFVDSNDQNAREDVNWILNYESFGDFSSVNNGPGLRGAAYRHPNDTANLVYYDGHTGNLQADDFTELSVNLFDVFQ